MERGIETIKDIHAIRESNPADYRRFLDIIDFFWFKLRLGRNIEKNCTDFDDDTHFLEIYEHNQETRGVQTDFKALDVVTNATLRTLELKPTEQENIETINILHKIIREMEIREKSGQLTS